MWVGEVEGWRVVWCGPCIDLPFQSSLTHPLLPPSPTLADASAEEEGEYDEEA